VRVTAKEARRMMRRLGVTERGVLAAVSA
jgi:hypothetical protein